MLENGGLMTYFQGLPRSTILIFLSILENSQKSHFHSETTLRLNQSTMYSKIPGGDRLDCIPESSMTRIVFHVLGLGNIKANIKQCLFTQVTMGKPCLPELNLTVNPHSAV